MYEQEETKRAYNEIRAQQYAGLAQSGLYQAHPMGLSSSPPPQPVIAQAILQELQSLLEKARMVENRQINLKDRIFGSSPQSETAGLKDVSPNGFLHEANVKIQSLHTTLDRVIQNCIDLERLA